MTPHGEGAAGSTDSPRRGARHPFTRAFRAAVDARGEPLRWLHDRLTARGARASMAVLTYWFTGTRQPEPSESLDVVILIEEELGLPAGALSALIRPLKTSAQADDVPFPWDDDALAAAVAEAFNTFETGPAPGIQELSVHAVTDVGPDGGVARRRTRLLLQSTGLP
ncbi:MAG: hypothetical protein WA971_12945, partial [Microbacterium sp.]